MSFPYPSATGPGASTTRSLQAHAAYVAMIGWPAAGVFAGNRHAGEQFSTHARAGPGRGGRSDHCPNVRSDDHDRGKG